MFLKWFGMQFPSIRIFAIPNGIRTGFKQAIKAKREGMKSGVPDLFIPQLCVWVEMKRSRGGSLSPEQKDWIHYLEEHCEHRVIVAHGFKDGADKLMALLSQEHAAKKDC